ncbi:MAG: MBL fold metallo-hydrolase [Deltaproteobacteria bacterium]|nr:MBL fold metallo-hydrolase [Deltaproteobacteria bacterium]
MKIQHLRNATALITIGDRVLLLDPMFGEVGSKMGLRVFRGERRRNPLVPMPSGWEQAVEKATDVLVTHQHFDHLDGRARHWTKQRGLPVWASSIDVPYLRKSGLDAKVLRGGTFDSKVERIPARHGRGVIGWLMGHVSGFYLAHPDEPAIYIIGDSVPTKTVSEALDRLQPEIVLVPAGAANFGFGGDILFSIDELVELTRNTTARVIFHHLESLDHCPTTRHSLRQRMKTENLLDRVLIPEDGETMVFSRQDHSPRPKSRTDSRPGPDFRKWITSKLG